MKRRRFISAAVGGSLAAGVLGGPATAEAAAKVVRNQVYRCSVCGNITQVRHAGRPALVCCGKPMTLLVEKTKDEGLEKHVPVVETVDGGIKVKVGSVPRPMVANHYIEWIEVLVDGDSHCKFLKPGARPEAVFALDAKGVTVREYCNLHGLWRANP